MKRFVTLVFALWSLVLGAQDFRGQIEAEPAKAGGYMYAYPFTDVSDTPAPKGYKPFYISHYGRHGSRYHTSSTFEKVRPVELLRAREAGALTPRGLQLLGELQQIMDAHEGMAGELSRRGMEEQERLAERMFRRFGDVFKARKEVHSISSDIARCLMSMTAFTGRLQKQQPSLSVRYNTGKKYFDLLCHGYLGFGSIHAVIDSVDRVCRGAWFDPSRLMADLFVPGYPVEDPQGVASRLYELGGIAQCLDVDVDPLRFFTPDELYVQWALGNNWIFGGMGNSVENGGRIVPAAADLLSEVISRADAAVAVGSPVAADLRFGHDAGLLPLVGLMGIEGFGTPLRIAEAHKSWATFERTPMGANLQLIFYRKGEDVLLKVLYNEQETGIEGLSPVSGPYYRWTDVRSLWLPRAHAPLPVFPETPAVVHPLATIKETPGLCPIFRTWGFIGDSMSSGEFVGHDDAGQRHWEDMYEYSWCQQMMRLMGAEGTNWTAGGLRADTWTFRFIDEGLSGWTSDGHVSRFLEDPKQAYVIALGLNDKFYNPIPHIPMGDAFTDICLEDLSRNAKTYAGYYGAIIQRIRRIQPKAKVFVLTMPAIFDNTYADYSQVVRDIASRFDSVYVLDLEREIPHYMEMFPEPYWMTGHLSAAGYLRTAHIVMTYIDWIIRNHPEEFTEASFIGTPLHK